MNSSLPPEEVILISPRRRSPEDASLNKRRKVTPSPESSLSRNFLVISLISSVRSQPLFAPSDFSPSFAADLFPGAEATIEFHETESSRLLFQVFPGTQRVDFDDRVLVYHFDQLPAKPWPKKIAGVPCFLTADPNDRGPIIPIRYRSRSKITVSENLDLRDNEAAVGLVFDLVRDFFAKTDISVTEIQSWGHIIIIVLENEDNKDETLGAVPRSVAQCNCFYLFESMMARPSKLSALRPKAASVTQIDDSRYDTMRPGVMLSSGKHPEEGWEILTSSGVLVKDPLGHEYITVAAHGFPGFPFDGKVYHPHSSDRALGEAVIELSHTDVALVKLRQGVEFINEPFENTLVPAPPFKLAGFARAAETRIGDAVFLDSPFSGFVEGTRGAHSQLRVPSDEPLEPEQIWISCQWDYMGQDSEQAMADGVCGSAIWDQNHRVLGFVRYALSSGAFLDWCMSISADYLLDKKYIMV
ncbi:uncharacterized protein N7515_004043 [Penicillium bovifimosum]|uniref:Uncharacterized protein n=1 Tax=Penicillium bovifimosum TaxID=126998 RepID=A0A9W9H5U1_9EURO|nr:uncharacterized protein N7515_004043 [Penicillium bovifimosum]KAJ5139195.1 hypothetical protein N7515_004043 [Penicillium bovifimosum]